MSVSTCISIKWYVQNPWDDIQPWDDVKLSGELEIFITYKLVLKLVFDQVLGYPNQKI